MSIGELTRLEIDDERENPALDIPALEHGTREMAKNGEKAEILLTHPEQTLIRGFAEKGTPRRFAPGGTVYHGDTECLHLAYPTDKGLTEFETEAKDLVEGLFSELVDENLYWNGRDLMVGEEYNPEVDPQLAGLALTNGKDYSIARSCTKATYPSKETEMMISEDGLTSPETYEKLNYFLEPQTGTTLQQHLNTEEKIQTVENYLTERGLDEDSYRAARELQGRNRGTEPRSCVTDFRPTS